MRRAKRRTRTASSSCWAPSSLPVALHQFPSHTQAAACQLLWAPTCCASSSPMGGGLLFRSLSLSQIEHSCWPAGQQIGRSGSRWPERDCNRICALVRWPRARTITRDHLEASRARVRADAQAKQAAEVQADRISLKRARLSSKPKWPF